MKHTYTIILSIIALTLTACGGGGSSSGGGTGAPIPDLARFVGTYTGTTTQQLTASGGSGTATAPITITLNADGVIRDRTEGELSGQCQFPPLVLTENPLTFRRSGTCVLVGAAQPCPTEQTGQLIFTGDAARADIDMVADCGAQGTLAADIRVNVTR